NLDCAVAVPGGAVTLAGASTVTETTYAATRRFAYVYGRDGSLVGRAGAAGSATFTCGAAGLLVSATAPDGPRSQGSPPPRPTPQTVNKSLRLRLHLARRVGFTLQATRKREPVARRKPEPRTVTLEVAG